jgi:hypothetical protein
MKQKLLLLYIAFNFFACKPEPEEVKPNQHLYSYLSKEQLEKTPYFSNPAFDTLNFVSNLNDTLTFVKTKTDSGFYEENYKDYPSGPTNYLYHQFIQNSYKTIKGEGSFWVRHSKKMSNQSKDILKINFNQFDVQFFDRTLADESFPTFIDSISINDKTYYNLTRYTINNGIENIAVTYVNNKHGMFYINDLKSQIIWVLL